MCSLSCIGGGGEGRGAAGRGRPTCHYLRMGVTGWKEEKGRSGSSALPVHSAISPSLSPSPSPRLYTHSVQRLLVGKVGTCQRCSTSAHRVAREHQRAPAMVSAMEQRLPKKRSNVRGLGRGLGGPVRKSGGVREHPP